MRVRYGIGVLVSIIMLLMLQFSYGTGKSERDRKKKYLGEVQEEIITFYALKKAGSSEKIMREGILISNKNASATVLMCHGFMCDKRDIGFMREIFKGHTIMTFDFRAHGEHVANQYCTFGHEEAYDVIGAVKFIKSHPDLKNKPLIVYGFSMGAVAAIQAYAEYAREGKGPLYDCAIFDCPFESTEGLLQRALEEIKFSLFGYEFSLPGRSFLQKYAYHPYVQSILKFGLKTFTQIDVTQVVTNLCPFSPQESIKTLTVPTFFIACKNDKKAPVSAVRAVYDGAGGYKRLWITNGRRHFDSYFYDPIKYTYKVRSFSKKFLQGTLTQRVQSKIIEDAALGYYKGVEQQ